MSELISIIIPSYNAEKYIHRCLVSVLNQTYQNIEIIIIDDCSVDNTVSEIKKFKDPRIQLITKEKNSGQGVSRNMGIRQAKGQYIGFIDSDDYIDLDYFEKLLKAAKEVDADVVMTGMRFVRPSHVLQKSPKEEVLNTFLEKFKIIKNGSTCDKLFKSTMLKEHQILFPENLFWEDNMFALKAVFYANKISTIADTFYYYVSNPSSTTRADANAEKRLKDSITIIEQMQTFAEDNNFSDTEKELLKEFIFLNIVQRATLENKEYISQIKQILKIKNHKKYTELNKVKVPFRYRLIKPFLNKKEYKKLKESLRDY